MFVLVRTSDKEGKVKSTECKAESEVIGVYHTEKLAEKAKRVEADGMDTSDQENYHWGDDTYTTFQIYEQPILTHVDTTALDNAARSESSEDED